MLLNPSLITFFAVLGLISLASIITYAVPQLLYYMRHKHFMLTTAELEWKAERLQYKARISELETVVQEKEKRATESERLLAQTVEKLTNMLN